MKANRPKLAKKYASAPTMEQIKKNIARFYCGEEKELRPINPGMYAVVSPVTGKVNSTVVIETPRGFYFGVPA